MKRRLETLIVILLTATFSWQSVAFADGRNLRPLAVEESDRMSRDRTPAEEMTPLEIGEPDGLRSAIMDIRADLLAQMDEEDIADMKKIITASQFTGEGSLFYLVNTSEGRICISAHDSLFQKGGLDEGRTVYLRLRRPATIDGSTLKVLRFKGTRPAVDAKGEVELYNGGGHLYTLVNANNNGNLILEDSPDDPSGAMLKREADVERKIMRACRGTDIKTDLYLGSGQYRNIRFRGEEVGYVVVGMEDDDIRMTGISEIKPISYMDPIPVVRGFNDFNDKAPAIFESVGRQLRALHDRGYHHRFPHLGNIGIRKTKTGYEVIIRDLGTSIPIPEGLPRRNAALRLIDIARVISDIAYYDYVSSGKLMTAFLRGYFKELDADSAGFNKLLGQCYDKNQLQRGGRLLRRNKLDKEELNPENRYFGVVFSELYKVAEAAPAPGAVSGEMPSAPAQQLFLIQVLRPLARAEEKSKAALSASDLYSRIQILMDNSADPEQQNIALDELKAYPDKELLRVRLGAVVRKVAEKRVAGNLERLGTYIRDTNPEFIRRYETRVRPIFLRKVMSEYLRFLNRDLREGVPGAELKRERLLAIVARIPPSSDNAKALDFLRDKLNSMGAHKEQSYYSNPISGKPPVKMKDADNAYRLLADAATRYDRRFMDEINRQVGAARYGYIIEAIGVYMSSEECAVPARTVNRDKAYLTKAISLISNNGADYRLCDKALGRRVLVNRLLHPDWDLRDCAKTKRDRKNYPSTRLHNMLYGREHPSVDNKSGVRAIVNLLRAEPRGNKTGNYITVFIHPCMLEKGPVVAGRYCYRLVKVGDKYECRRDIATKRARIAFEKAFPERFALEEMKPRRIRKVIDIGHSHYEETGELLGKKELAEKSGISFLTLESAYEEEVIKGLRAAGVPLIGKSWHQMRDFCRTIPVADLKAIAALNIEADLYLPRGTDNLTIGPGRKRFMNCGDYWRDEETKLGKDMLLVYLKRNSKENKIEICAVYKEGKKIRQKVIDELKTDENGNVIGMEDVTGRSLRSAVARQQPKTDPKPVRVNPQTGLFYVNSNYYGLTDILPNGAKDLPNVTVNVRTPEGEAPRIEIHMPDGSTEEIVLNEAMLPLCRGHTEDRHSYWVYLLLFDQTRLAKEEEDRRFKESPFVLSHPDFSKGHNPKYASFEAAAKAFCKMAGLSYDGTREKLQEAAGVLNDKGINYTALKNRDWAMWNMMRQAGIISPAQTISRPKTPRQPKEPKYPTYEAAATEFCRRAGLTYSEANVVEAASHSSNRYWNLRRTDRELWSIMKDKGIVKPGKGGHPPKYASYESAAAEFCRRANLEYSEVNVILAAGHPDNEYRKLREQDEKLWEIMKNAGKINRPKKIITPKVPKPKAPKPPKEPRPKREIPKPKEAIKPKPRPEPAKPTPQPMPEPEIVLSELPKPEPAPLPPPQTSLWPEPGPKITDFLLETAMKRVEIGYRLLREGQYERARKRFREVAALAKNRGNGHLKAQYDYVMAQLSRGLQACEAISGGNSHTQPAKPLRPAANPSLSQVLRPLAAKEHITPRKTCAIPEQRQMLLDAIEWRDSARERIIAPYGRATVYLTRYCNARCRVCITDAPLFHIGDKINSDLQMTEERLEKVIAFLNESGVHELIINGGGEPFLSDETINMFIKIITRVRKLEFVQVITNGLWAQDSERMNTVLERISHALQARGPARMVDFAFVFSVDQFHHPGGIDGVANVIDAFADRQGYLFPGYKRRCGTNFQIIKGKDTLSAFRSLQEKLKRVPGVSLHLENLEKDLDPKINPDFVYGEMALLAPRGEFHLGYFTFPIYTTKRLQRMIKNGTISIDEVRPYQTNLWGRDFMYGSYSVESFNTITFNRVSIDTDGTVSPECRNIWGSRGLIAGNISEGFSVIRERDLKDPILRAGREFKTRNIKYILEGIDPDYISRMSVSASNYDTLDELLSDEDIRLRVAFELLYSCYWNELTTESQQRITDLERRLFPEGIYSKKKINAAPQVLPDIAMEALGYSILWPMAIGETSPEWQEEAFGFPPSEPYEVHLAQCNDGTWIAKSAKGRFRYRVVMASSQVPEEYRGQFKDLFLEIWDYEEFLQAAFTDRASDRILVLLICEDDKSVAGAYYFDSTENWLHGIAVARKYRGTGAIDVIFEDMRLRMFHNKPGFEFRGEIQRSSGRGRRGYFRGTLNDFKQNLGVISVVNIDTAESLVKNLITTEGAIDYNVLKDLSDIEGAELAISSGNQECPLNVTVKDSGGHRHFVIDANGNLLERYIHKEGHFSEVAFRNVKNPSQMITLKVEETPQQYGIYADDKRIGVVNYTYLPEMVEKNWWIINNIGIFSRYEEYYRQGIAESINNIFAKWAKEAGRNFAALSVKSPFEAYILLHVLRYPTTPDGLKVTRPLIERMPRRSNGNFKRPFVAIGGIPNPIYLVGDKRGGFLAYQEPGLLIAEEIRPEDKNAVSSILRPMAMGEEILNEAALNMLFEGMEKHALEAVGRALEQEIPLVSELLQSLPGGKYPEAIREMLGSVLDSMRQTDEYFKRDYSNFPGSDPRQEMRDSLVNCLGPACCDMASMFNRTNVPEELRAKLDTVLRINMTTLRYAEIYSCAVYFIENRQSLVDFTEWLNRSENRKHLKAFADLFNSITPEIISTKRTRPVYISYFRKGSIGPLISVVGVINEFLSQQKTGAAPKSGELKNGVDLDVQAQI